jgi:hypothetical protein
MSAFGCKADIAFCEATHMSAFDPKRTLRKTFVKFLPQKILATFEIAGRNLPRGCQINDGYRVAHSRSINSRLNFCAAPLEDWSRKTAVELVIEITC